MDEILKYNQKKPTKAPIKQQGKPLPEPTIKEKLDMQQIDELFKIVHNIPKIELHAHIGGCIRPQTFLELAEAKGIDIEHIDFYHVDIKMAFEIFKVGSKLITDIKTLKKITAEIIEDYSKQNTRYLELRSGPKVIGEIKSKEDYVKTIIDTIKEMEQHCPKTKVTYLVSINRAGTVEDAQEAVELVMNIREQSEYSSYLTGIELSGDPR